MHYTPAELAYLHTQARARALQLRHQTQMAVWQGLRTMLRQSLAGLQGIARHPFVKRRPLARDTSTSPTH